jgi:hypothetical protein
VAGDRSPAPKDRLRTDWLWWGVSLSTAATPTLGFLGLAGPAIAAFAVGGAALIGIVGRAFGRRRRGETWNDALWR